MHKQAIESAVGAIELTRSDDKFVVTSEGKNYHVKQSFFEMLEAIRSHGASAAFEKVGLAHGLSPAEVAQLAAGVASKLDEIMAPRKGGHYIKLPLTIFPASIVAPICRRLTFLFAKPILIALALIGACIHAWFVVTHALFDVKEPVIAFSPMDGAIVSATILLALLFHEFGHSTATLFHGLRPKRIGFGFYFGLPVLFADVTEAWKLGKSARLSINLAGIYFQSIVNSLLFVVILLADEPLRSMAINVFRVNMLVALMVIVPFIRNDGYWVVSDLFDIQNLNRTSFLAPYWFFRKHVLKIAAPPVSTALFLYSLSNYAFLVFTMYTFLGSTPGTASNLVALVANGGAIELLGKQFGLLLTAIFSLIGVFLIAKALVQQFVAIGLHMTKWIWHARRLYK